MEFATYVRKPFLVEAVEIDADNIEEIAGRIGKLIQKDGAPMIQVDPRVVPNIRKVYIGYYLTDVDSNLRVYSPKAFAKEFKKGTPDIMPWVEYMNRPDEVAVVSSVTVCAHGVDLSEDVCHTCVSLRLAEDQKIQPVNTSGLGDTSATNPGDYVKNSPGDISTETSEELSQPEAVRCPNCRSVDVAPSGSVINCNACGGASVPNAVHSNVFEEKA